MKDKQLSPLQGIRKKCLDCVCGDSKEVALCPCTQCGVYPFRYGHNPNRKGIGNRKSNLPKLTEIQ